MSSQRHEDFVQVVGKLQSLYTLGLITLSGGVELLLRSIQLKDLTRVLLSMCHPHVLLPLDFNTLARSPSALRMEGNPSGGVYFALYKLHDCFALYTGQTGNFLRRVKHHRKNHADGDKAFHYSATRDHSAALFLVAATVTDAAARQLLAKISGYVEGGTATIKFAARELLEIVLMQTVGSVQLPAILASSFASLKAREEHLPLNRELEMRICKPSGPAVFDQTVRRRLRTWSNVRGLLSGYRARIRNTTESASTMFILLEPSHGVDLSLSKTMLGAWPTLEVSRMAVLSMEARTAPSKRCFKSSNLWSRSGT